MSKGLKSASERYLEAAARNLAQKSPAVSAHLMLIKNSKELKKSVFQDGVCQRCGTVQVPGKTSEAKIERLKKVEPKVKRQGHNAKPAKKSHVSSKRERWLRMECKACHAIERTALDSLTSDRTDGKKSSSRQPQSSKTPEDRDPAIARSTNQSSKARAKARRGGLQAMLAKAKEPSNPGGGLGLDLMDLMKEGDS